jgi:uncharacterized protein YkwD
MAPVHAATRRVRSNIVGALLLVIGIAASLCLGRAPAAHAEERATDLQPERRDASLTSLGRSLLDWTNHVRDRHGLRPLRSRNTVVRYAARHSRRMAQRHSLFHSTTSQLTDVLSGTGWNICGENVGYGSSLHRIERGFWRSAPHRENILRRSFDHAGIGVVRTARLTWVTVVFYGT